MRRGLAVGAILFALTLPSWMTAQQPKETVAGRVVSALDHKPIPGAAVVLRDTSSPRIAGETMSDAEGRYKFESIPAGRYNLSAVADGYIHSSYLQHEQYSSAVVTGAGLGTGSLVLELTPAGRIAGKLTDESGEPLQAGSSIRLFHQSPDTGDITPSGSVPPHEDGQYSFENLTPGVYYLVASGTPWYAIHTPEALGRITPAYRTSIDPSLDVAYPVTYFPNAYNSKDASPINLQEGEAFTANMQLSPQKAMTLSAEIPTTSTSSQAQRILPELTQTIFGEEVRVPVGIQMMNGKFATGALPAGQYHLRTRQLTAQNVLKESPEFSETIDLTTSSSSVDLSRVSPATVLVVTLHTSDGKSFPPKTGISLTQASNFQGVSAELDDQSKATFKNVPAGIYQVRLNASGHASGILSITFNGNLVSDGRIHVGDGAANTMDIVASRSVVKLAGVARRDAKPAAGSMMVLVPAGKDTSEYLFRQAQSDLDGSFSFAQVTPGNYLLVAIEDGWKIRYTDLKALSPYLLHALPVAVPDNGSTQMHLPEPATVQTLQP